MLALLVNSRRVLREDEPPRGNCVLGSLLVGNESRRRVCDFVPIAANADFIDEVL
jgi:hypothetical protein